MATNKGVKPAVMHKDRRNIKLRQKILNGVKTVGLLSLLPISLKTKTDAMACLVIVRFVNLFILNPLKKRKVIKFNKNNIIKFINQIKNTNLLEINDGISDEKQTHILKSASI
jgi:hypothetical protein